MQNPETLLRKRQGRLSWIEPEFGLLCWTAELTQSVLHGPTLPFAHGRVSTESSARRWTPCLALPPIFKRTGARDCKVSCLSATQLRAYFPVVFIDGYTVKTTPKPENPFLWPCFPDTMILRNCLLKVRLKISPRFLQILTYIVK